MRSRIFFCTSQYGRYLQYGAEECLLRSGGLMCPSPGCGAGLFPPEDSRRVECDRQLGCGFVFCKNCREGYHEGACPTELALPTDEASQVSWLISAQYYELLTTGLHVSSIWCVKKEKKENFSSPLCPVSPQGFVVDEEASLRGRWDQASVLLLQETTKRCPQCSVRVERNGERTVWFELVWVGYR